MTRPVVVFGILGATLDAGTGPNRWKRWRPTVALGQHDDFAVARLELLHARAHAELARVVTADLRQVSPSTEVRSVPFETADPWDFEEVYAALHDVARGYAFRPEREEYLVHITTGTHVAQICAFLLTEARYFPAKLLQTSPPAKGAREPAAGTLRVIDLDLSRYDRLASRFRREHDDAQSLLKSGIPTKNAAFNAMIARVEEIAVASRAPVLLLGPTGAGKSQLARRIFALKKARQRLEGPFVEVNCATLRGDAAMSALFGHVKGAFTGALADRAGLLRKANGGVLFLDEIGELGADEQAMLLRAIEEGVFYPMGADKEVKSEFSLVAGSNRDVERMAASGRFRADLLARLNLWTFRLPALRDRPEDVAPNLDFELEEASRATGVRVTMSREARTRYVAFATSPEAVWPGNFRDLDASVTRMATLARGGRIDAALIDEEIARLRALFATFDAPPSDAARSAVDRLLGPTRAAALDRFDRVQLEEVLRVCARASSLSEAGRLLFAASRAARAKVNDADRLRKYLARFGLSFAGLPRNRDTTPH